MKKVYFILYIMCCTMLFGSESYVLKECGIMTNSSCEDVAEKYLQGKKQDKLKGENILNELCFKFNFTPSCSKLGYIYFDGIKDSSRYKKSIKAFVKVCKDKQAPNRQLGCAMAQSVKRELASLEKLEKSVNISKYKKACEDKNYKYCIKLGNFYYESFDYKKSLALFKLSCEHENLKGCNMLAEMYRRGQGVEKSAKKASEILDTTCKKGDMESCEDYARLIMFEYKNDTNKIKQAYKIYEKTCKMGEVFSCLDLAKAYKKGDIFKADEQKMFKYLSIAEKNALEKLKSGNARMCQAVASVYGYDGLVLDAKKALYFYDKSCEGGYDYGCQSKDRFKKIVDDFNSNKKLCEQNNASACNEVAYAYNLGKLVKKDTIKWQNYMRKACELGKESSCLNLSYSFNLDKKIEYMKKMCANDYAQACRSLAYVYQDNKYSHELIRSAFKKACDLGDNLSCNQHESLQYVDNQIVKEGEDMLKAKEYKKAFNIFKPLCERKNKSGCFYLGVMYDNGFGVIKDLKKAFKLYALSCELGSTTGCENLSYMYSYASGVEKDLKKAYELQKKVCEKGVLRVCNNLAEKYEYGIGVKKDLKKAFSLYKQTCEGKYYRGCNNLGLMYEFGKGMTKDYKKAFNLYKKACENEEIKGCFNLGLMYDEGKGIKQNYETAVKFYRYVCENKDMMGCFSLGLMYKGGDGVEKDLKKAMDLFELSCEKKYTNGCFILGNIYTKNEKISKDISKAKFYYKKACDLGDKEACDKYNK